MVYKILFILYVYEYAKTNGAVLISNYKSKLLEFSFINTNLLLKTKLLRLLILVYISELVKLNAKIS